MLWLTLLLRVKRLLLKHNRFTEINEKHILLWQQLAQFENTVWP